MELSLAQGVDLVQSLQDCLQTSNIVVLVSIMSTFMTCYQAFISLNVLGEGLVKRKEAGIIIIIMCRHNYHSCAIIMHCEALM